MDIKEQFARELQAQTVALYSLLLGITDDPTATHDLLQETKARLLSLRPAAMVEVRSVPAYAHVVARNLAFEWLENRRVARRRDVSGYENVPLQLLMDKSQDPLLRLGAAEELKHLLMEINNSLPARCREAVLLVKVCRYSAAEAAVKMSVRPQSVKNLLRRAILHTEKSVRKMPHARGVVLLARLLNCLESP